MVKMSVLEFLVCSARFERAPYASERRKLISCKRLLMADLSHPGSFSQIVAYRPKGDD